MPFQKRGNNSGGWGGGKKSYSDRGGDRGGFRDRDRGGFGDRGFQKEMHRATCAQCNQSCEVPFKPNGRKPVYCSNCFKRDEGDRPSFRGNDDYNKPSYDKKPAFTPSFGGSSNGYNPDAKNAELIKEQFRIVNMKLDTIMKALVKTVQDEVMEDELMLDDVPEPKKAAKAKATKKKKAA